MSNAQPSAVHKMTDAFTVLSIASASVLQATSFEARARAMAYLEGVVSEQTRRFTEALDEHYAQLSEAAE